MRTLIHAVLLASVVTILPFVVTTKAEMMTRETELGNDLFAPWFRPAQPEGDIDAHVAAIKALPGRTSVLVLTDSKLVAAHDADIPLAVASAGKLAVLLALKNAVSDGRLSWEDVVTLDPKWRSLPSGQLQDWPDGTPLTIASLAHLMISVSDNTATDALIHLVGREAIQAVSRRNIPFVDTRNLHSSNGRECPASHRMVERRR
jgi:beta-lactamase class A